MDKKLVDDMKHVAGSALEAMAGVKQQIEDIVQRQLTKLLKQMDLVTREEFDVVKEMAQKARLEQEALKARLEELEQPSKKK